MTCTPPHSPHPNPRHTPMPQHPKEQQRLVQEVEATLGSSDRAPSEWVYSLVLLPLV